MDSEFINLIAFAVSINISVVAIGKGMQRFISGLAFECIRGYYS